jgi:shikimate dehydrogenase
MKIYGLIGFPLSHSFSQKYFTQKFEKEGIFDCQYRLFPMENLDALPAWLKDNPELAGLNVTIPHKLNVIPLLDEIDPMAKKIGAVNVLKKRKNGSWKGYNSDYYGFLHSMFLLRDAAFWKGKKALILGTGGSSKAVKAALEHLQMEVSKVSRTQGPENLSYDGLNAHILSKFSLLVNCTPLGMDPLTVGVPPIPLEGLHSSQMAIDLVYNPEKTLFLEKCEQNGLAILNGLPMLYAQAEKAWEIWNSPED